MNYLNTTTLYTHIEKGGIYRILHIHKMKHPDTGKWIPCVTYKSINDNRIWTRSIESFIANFKDYFEYSSVSCNESKAM